MWRRKYLRFGAKSIQKVFECKGFTGRMSRFPPRFSDRRGHPWESRSSFEEVIQFYFSPMSQFRGAFRFTE